MAGKRRADVELNQDNWADEQDSQEAGTFERADKASLSNRKILSVKSRRSNTQGTAGLFKSFTGLSSVPNYTASSFNFSGNNPVTTTNTATNLSSGAGSKVPEEAEYLKCLQTLNQNLHDWISKHITLDPHCILTPIFTDYERHLKQLHERYPTFATPITEPSLIESLRSSTAPNLQFSGLNGKSDLTSASSSAPSNTATTISSVIVATTSSTAPKLSFGFSFPPINKSNPSDPPLFRFGSSLPSSSPFAQPLATTTTTTTTVATAAPTTSATTVIGPSTVDDDEEEYQPPKPVVKEFKEEGSVYSIRCKLFYKWENDWRERGVGNLYIKPMSDGKFQLLIRADTNLGNILLNVLITKDIPIKPQKNNVTFVCVPSPALPQTNQKSVDGEDQTAKPVPMLIRVKTVDEASELIKQLDLHRGLADSTQ